MSQHFIENIKIENFKCFENLEITGFRRVNLFGGKNNVGKTALLEAIEMFVKSIDVDFLIFNVYVLLRRRQGNYDEMEVDIFKDQNQSILISSLHRRIVIKKDDHLDLFGGYGLEGEFVFSVNAKEKKFSFEQVNDRRLTFLVKERIGSRSIVNSFIRSSKPDENEIAILYGAIVETGKEMFIDESLNQFDKDIVSFKTIATERKTRSKIKLNSMGGLVSLSSLGDGVSRYISMLCAIWANQHGFLFIDEIENGIHYSNYKKLWQLIFMASEQADCQIFVTSHSKECIAAFNEVQQELHDNAGNYFELYKSERKQRIVAAMRDAEQLQYALTHGEAIRGE